MKILFLFIAIYMTILNIVKVHYKNDLGFINIGLQTIGIIGFIILQFNI